MFVLKCIVPVAALIWVMCLMMALLQQGNDIASFRRIKIRTGQAIGLRLFELRLFETIDTVFF